MIFNLSAVSDDFDVSFCKIFIHHASMLNENNSNGQDDDGTNQPKLHFSGIGGEIVKSEEMNNTIYIVRCSKSRESLSLSRGRFLSPKSWGAIPLLCEEKSTHARESTLYFWNAQ